MGFEMTAGSSRAERDGHLRGALDIALDVGAGGIGDKESTNWRVSGGDLGRF
jgi:hypothetical protein